MRLSLVLIGLMLVTSPAVAFMKGGCGEGACVECHQLDKKDTEALAPLLGGKIVNVEAAEVPGLWLIEYQRRDGKIIPAYLDYSKTFILRAQVTRIADNKDMTISRILQKNPVDMSRVALDDALLLGSAEAKYKAVLFTDPRCPYCSDMHKAIKEVVDGNPDIAFYIKMLPLPMHQDAYPIAKSIVCTKSMELLEKSLAKEQNLQLADCETTAVDETMLFAQQNLILSTPTLVLPDGQIVPGLRKASEIVSLLRGEPAAPVTADGDAKPAEGQPKK